MSAIQRSARQTLRRVKWKIDPILEKLGYRLEKKRDLGPTFLSRLLLDRIGTGKKIAFVQIGANDGISTDPIYPLVKMYPDRFRGVVVEPLKDKFALLQRAYVDVAAVVPVNVAIHNTERMMQIHRVRPESEKRLPAWARGIGSFNPDHHKLSDLNSSHMTTESVPCITFDELVKQYGMNDIELLVTDTEGYDYEIVRNIDFRKYRPAYIHFEHGLSAGVMSWEKYKNLVGHLAQQGYSISHDTSDATAFLPESLAISAIDASSSQGFARAAPTCSPSASDSPLSH
jgi:FkbM family methyltransferase